MTKRGLFARSPWFLSQITRRAGTQAPNIIEDRPSDIYSHDKSPDGKTSFLRSTPMLLSFTQNSDRFLGPLPSREGDRGRG
jgi:hypothetical protein